MTAETKNSTSWDLNFFQNIAATGVVVSMVAQVGLYLMEKNVRHFEAVYLVWVLVFLFGTAIRYTKWGTDLHEQMNHAPHHHHDEDDHDHAH